MAICSALMGGMTPAIEICWTSPTGKRKDSVMTSKPPLQAAIIPVTPLQQNCCLIWCTETMQGAFTDPAPAMDHGDALRKDGRRPNRA